MDWIFGTFNVINLWFKSLGVVGNCSLSQLPSGERQVRRTRLQVCWALLSTYLPRSAHTLIQGQKIWLKTVSQYKCFISDRKCQHNHGKPSKNGPKVQMHFLVLLITSLSRYIWWWFYCPGRLWSPNRYSAQLLLHLSPLLPALLCFIPQGSFVWAKTFLPFQRRENVVAQVGS